MADSNPSNVVPIDHVAANKEPHVQNGGDPLLDTGHLNDSALAAAGASSDALPDSFHQQLRALSLSETPPLLPDPAVEPSLTLRRSQTVRSDPNACIFVASLSSARTEQQLAQSVETLFSTYGPIRNVKVLTDSANRPYAFVQFADASDARRAMVQAQHAILDGRKIRIEPAKVNRTLFLAKFSREASQPEIQSMLEAFGPIEELSILQNFETGQSKGCGFVKFKYREDAIDAFATLRAHSRWVVEWSSNMDRGVSDVDRTCLFVGGLDCQRVTEAMLLERFSSYGPVSSVEIIRRSGLDTTCKFTAPDVVVRVHGLTDEIMVGGVASTTFGFVRFISEESAKAALECENGVHWMGHCLRVHWRETDKRFRHRTGPVSPGSPGARRRTRSVPMSTIDRSLSHSYPMEPWMVAAPPMQTLVETSDAQPGRDVHTTTAGAEGSTNGTVSDNSDAFETDSAHQTQVAKPPRMDLTQISMTGGYSNAAPMPSWMPILMYPAPGTALHAVPHRIVSGPGQEAAAAAAASYTAMGMHRAAATAYPTTWIPCYPPPSEYGYPAAMPLYSPADMMGMGTPLSDYGSAMPYGGPPTAFPSPLACNPVQETMRCTDTAEIEPNLPNPPAGNSSAASHH